MAFDRFIYWQDHKPSMADIATVLVDYIGQHIGKVEWQENGQCWFVTFPGNSSHPLENLDPGGPTVTMHDERWFEVYLGENNIDVITRGQSPLVHDIADGFAKFAAQYWQARLEQGDGEAHEDQPSQPLTRETFALRWSEHLSGYGRVELVAEAFADCGLTRDGEKYFGDMSMKRYDEMCKQLFGYGKALMREIHSRLAGQGRRSGKQPSQLTESLLTFGPVN